MKVFTAGYTFASYAYATTACCGWPRRTSMGQWMDQMTRGWLIYELRVGAAMGLATALRGLPLLFFGILAGAVADRSNRKSQLIMAQVINALLNVILATLVLLRLVQPWHVYVTGFLAGTVQAFQQPARQTLISDIVGARHLMNALALNSMALNVASFRAGRRWSPYCVYRCTQLVLYSSCHVRAGDPVDRADGHADAQPGVGSGASRAIPAQHRRGTCLCGSGS